MRLWHYAVLPYLPRSQLLAQWRELNSMYAKEDRHILINYAYEYPKSELYLYSQMVLEEMQKRGFQIRAWDKYHAYFADEIMHVAPKPRPVFVQHHDFEYLQICYFNLAEKYLRGQKDYPQPLFARLQDLYQQQCTALNQKTNIV